GAVDDQGVVGARAGDHDPGDGRQLEEVVGRAGGVAALVLEHVQQQRVVGVPAQRHGVIVGDVQLTRGGQGGGGVGQLPGAAAEGGHQQGVGGAPVVLDLGDGHVGQVLAVLVPARVGPVGRQRAVQPAGAAPEDDRGAAEVDHLGGQQVLVLE